MCCVALPCCLFDLACFFLLSFSSLIKTCTWMMNFNPWQVLENVSSLNLSHNRLHSLDGITSFVSITSLNLNYNLVATRKDLNRLMQLRRLSTLCLQGALHYCTLHSTQFTCISVPLDCLVLVAQLVECSV